jgi:hypothetical protein
MKYIKLFEQFEMTPLYEEVNSIMGGELTEAEIQDMLNEGLFGWLKGLFSNPKKKKELDRLAAKLVETRVEIAKIDIQEDDIEALESELEDKADPYSNPNAKAKFATKSSFDKNDPTQIKKSQLQKLEEEILAQMTAIGEENEKLGKYVSKVKLDSRMESTEQVMKLADAQMKKVLTKMYRKDKKISNELNKELKKN